MAVVRFETPEVTFEEVIRRARVYRDISKYYAETGETLNAIVSLWAADLYSAQIIFWDHLSAHGGDQEEQFFTIGTRMSQMAGEFATSRSGYFKNAQDLAEACRDTVESSLTPKSLRVRYHEQRNSTNYLRLLTAPTLDDVYKAYEKRLQGLTPQQYIAARRAEGDQYLDQSISCRANSDLEEALRSFYDGYLLYLEAYLVETALAVGDTGLLSVQPRWDLAANYIESLEALPHKYADACIVIQGAVSEALGRVEGARFHDMFPEKYIVASDNDDTSGLHTRYVAQEDSDESTVDEPDLA